MSTLHNLIEHYQTSGMPALGIRTDYFRIVRGLRDLDRNEYIQDPSFLCGIHGMPRSDDPPPGKANPGDTRTDVPVWFGDLDSATLKVCVVGSESRDTDAAFNIVRVGTKIFGSPFGADRWNRHTTVPRRPQIRYFEILQPLLNPRVCLLLTDAVKEYAVVDPRNPNRANDRNARRQFQDLWEKWRAFLVAEIEIIRPNCIIALGQDVYNAIVDAGLGRRYRAEMVTHPAAYYGGAATAKEHILRLARELSLPAGDDPIQGAAQEGQTLIAGRSPVPARQTVQPKNLTRITSADAAATNAPSGGNIRPYAGPRDKYSLVASYLKQHHAGWTVQLPSKATERNLRVSDSTPSRSVSLYVRFCQDKLQKHCERCRVVLGNHLMAMGWWAFRKQDLRNSRADFWVFVLTSLAEQKTSFIIISPRELLQRLQPIRGHTEDRIDMYLSVTKQGRCWETRNLPRALDRAIDNGTYSDPARDFSTFLNASHLVAARLRNQLRGSTRSSHTTDSLSTEDAMTPITADDEPGRGVPERFFQELIKELEKPGRFSRVGYYPPRNYIISCTPHPRARYGLTFAEGAQVRAGVFIDSGKREDKNKRLFDELAKVRQAAEAEFGQSLRWERRDAGKPSRIVIYRTGSITDDDATLQAIKAWAIDALLNFKEVFDPRLAHLRSLG